MAYHYKLHQHVVTHPWRLEDLCSIEYNVSTADLGIIFVEHLLQGVPLHNERLGTKAVLGQIYKFV